MYENVNKQQCLVEIETAVSKYLWTLRKECDDENEESEVSEHDRNIKSSTSCRMTDKRNEKSNKTLNTSELSDVNVKASEESMNDASYESLNDRSRLTGKNPSTSNAQSNTDKVPKNGAKDNIDSMAIRTRSQTRKLALENQIQPNSINTNPSQPVKNTPTTHANPTPTDPRPLKPSTTHHKVSKDSMEERQYHYNVDNESFDFRNLRPTDMPNNKHIFLPQNEKKKTHNDEEEINLAFLSLQLQKATDEFIDEHIVEPNLTDTEMKGLKSLMKRKDITVFKTDKSSRFSVDEKTNYIKATKKHAEQDQTINEQTYSQLQKEVNAHSLMWTEFLKIGEATGENSHQRVRENMISSDRTDPPPLYSLRKDHKNYSNQEEGPPTRPVCGATAAHNGKLSHLISLILKEIKRNDETSCESTEDVMAAVQVLNREHTVLKGNKLMVGSLDVKALYPNLDIQFAAEIIAKEFLESNIEILNDSVDIYQLGIYLVLTCTEEELASNDLKDYCPQRINVLGRKPTLTGQAFTSNEKKAKVWKPPTNPFPNSQTTKKMLAKALEIGINAVMNAHVYKFAGEIKAQKQGGAIGLELTGEIAGVFMSWWDKEMKKKMSEKNIEVVLYKRYVDDINMVIEMNEEEKEDEVWRMIRETGNQIHESIQLEADHPSNHEDQKVPILDIKVWVETEGNHVMHEYYSKTVSSKAVIDEKSAMPLKDKRTVLTQDLLRVIMRCSPDLPWHIKKAHIEEYSLRMQFSGYKEEFRKEIVRSAINAYQKIKRKVKKGKRPLYRTKEWNKNERAKDKRKKKSTWYKRNKGEGVYDKNEYKSVLFVQPTRNSALKRKYEEVIKRSSCNMKVIERAGKSISQKLQKSYPFSREKCSCDDCFVCLSDGKGNCMKENVNYEIECTRERCDYIYYGETCRNAYSRGREHLKGIERRDRNSVFVEHVKDKHDSDFSNDKCCGYKMTVRETHKTALDRQITEAVKIDMSNKQTLNRKTGFRVNNVLSLRSSLALDGDDA